MVTKSKYILIGIALMSLLLYGLDIATAETGTVTVSTDQIFNYPVTGGAGGAGVLTNFSMFFFDTSDYNKIVNMSMQMSANNLNYPSQSNVTEFSCVAPSTCSGIVSYSQALNRISWSFDPVGINIISNPLFLEYDDAIFTGFTIAGAGTTSTDNAAASVSQPFALYASNGFRTERYNAQPSIQYGIDVSTSATVNYNVTYPIPGFYQFFVDKTGNTVSSRVFFHSQSNQTVSQAYETTFTTTNFTGASQYTDGLYLNLSLSGGQFNEVLINASGSTVPVPPTSPGNGGSDSGQIYYDFSSGTLGSGYGINVSILDANFSTFTRYYINATALDDVVPGFPVTVSTQTYSTGRLWSFDNVGTYNATLQYCNIFDITCSNTFGILHDLDVASITINPVTVNIEENVNQKLLSFQPVGFNNKRTKLVGSIPELLSKAKATVITTPIIIELNIFPIS